MRTFRYTEYFTLLLLLSFLGLGLAAWGASLNSPPPILTIEPAPTGSTTHVHATPPSGHHINIDAPLYLQLDNNSTRLQPTKKGELKSTFTLTPNAKASEISVSLFLCDDKKTYCENHIVKKKSLTPRIVP